MAWHETMELHELVAFQSNALMTLKKVCREIRDPRLSYLYEKAIHTIKKNLHELLPFYSATPYISQYNHHHNTAHQAGNLLGISKTAVRNYGNAITEVATPALRRVLTRQLHRFILLHAKVFHYMQHHSYYPAYDLDRLLYQDQMNAERALRMPY